MRVLIQGRAVQLKDDAILGVGGEATVYAHRDLAVKIFHDTDRTLLDAKLRKIDAFPVDLPPEVVAPIALALDSKTRTPVGYVMPAISGASEVARLAKRSFREGLFPTDDVCRLFAGVHQVLQKLHGRSVVAGDLNDGNILFAGTKPWLIDVDSMQLPGHPCTVGHERFLDPGLYGMDLTGTCAFSAGSDWYSFAVLLFCSLLYVHPYGGVHPKYPTMLRRAEAGVSVFDADVKYPKAAVHYRVLPDELLHRFAQIFEQRERGVFPEQLLDQRWTRCRCGLEHARPVCPDCASKNAIARQTLVRHRGSCRAIRIFGTRGRILAAVTQPALAYVYEEDGVVRREDGSRVMMQAPEPGIRFAIAGARTWVGLGDQVVAVEGEEVVDRTVTSLFAGEPAFDAALGGAFLVQDGWLLERNAGMRVGKVLDGQTFVRTGHRLGLGFYRAGRAMVSFLFRPGRPGLIDTAIPPIDGRLLFADAVFDEHHVLVSFQLDQRGQRLGALYLIRDDGKVIGRREGPESDPLLATTTGRALQDGRMLVGTEEGLTALAVDGFTGTIVERTVFSDTEPFVPGGAQILPGPDGSVYVVTTNQITQLVLS